jgi:hypothetical protein
MWHSVDVVLADVSEERIASIFRVEGKIRKIASEETLRTGTLKMEAILSSETSVNTSSTRCHIPEDCFLHSHRRENLKSYNMFTILDESSVFLSVLLSITLHVSEMVLLVMIVVLRTKITPYISEFSLWIMKAIASENSLNTKGGNPRGSILYFLEGPS